MIPKWLPPGNEGRRIGGKAAKAGEKKPPDWGRTGSEVGFGLG